MAGMLAGANGFADTWDPADDVPGSNAALLEPQSVEASHGPHTLSDADVADWYRIYLEAGRVYAFRADSGDDMYSELYSDLAGQNMVAWNDDRWGGTQFELVYPVATSGWYSLKVRTYDGTGNATYSLLHSIWSREPADVPRLEGVATNRIQSGDYLVLTGSGWGGAFGTGRDGSCVLTGHANINTQALVSGRSCPDAVNYSVAALASNAAALTEAPGPGCLAAGDEVMLINLQGTAGAATNVGNHEFLRVQSVTGSNVVFTENLTRFYGNGAADQTNVGTNATQQRVMLQRVPNYANLHSVFEVRGNAWDGQRGGVMSFRVRGRAQLNGALDMWGKGYRGGTQMVGDNTLAFQGESIAGLGIQTQAVNQTGGGGGRKLAGYSAAGGGGGGHRLKGVNGGATSSGTTNGMGGNPVGDAALEKVFMGGGGGGGANTNAAVDGGQGGGIILVSAQDLEIADESSYIDAEGVWITASNSPAGGGAGGSIRLTGRKIAIGAGTNDMVWVYGGGGGRTSPNWGGGGSAGRIAMYYQDTLQAKVGEFVCTNRRYEPVRVFMNGVESPDVTVVNPTTLAAKVPAGISGAVNVKALSADGQASVLSNAVQVASVPASGGDWWSVNWNFRRPLSIFNPGTQALTNQTVTFAIPFESGMQADFDDLRFVDSAQNELPYWLAAQVNGTGTEVRVVVPLLPALQTTVIYQYFGNDAAVGGGSYQGVKNAVGTGLVSRWALDEGTGSAAINASTNAIAGTISGASWIGADSLAATGNSLRFPAGACVDMGNPAALNFGTNDFSFSLWMRSTNRPAANTYPMVLAKEKGSAPRQGYTLMLAPTNGNAIFELFSDGSAARPSSSNSVCDGRWHHIVAVRAGSEARLFVDGRFQSAAIHPMGLFSVSNSSTFRLAGHGNGSAEMRYAGDLDEVAVYGRALAAEEVVALYEHRRVVAPAPLLTWGANREVCWSGDSRDWLYWRKLTLDHTKIDAPLTNFPVLVRLTTNNFDFAKARADGFDVRFALADGTALDYERERHDAAAGKAEYWVRLPAVSSAADTDFYVYYGNSAAADGANAAGVWDGGFAGVWHFGATTNTGTRDSTVNTNHGSLIGGAATLEGKSGPGLSLNGSSAYAQCAHSPSLNISGDITLSAWVYPKTNLAAGMRVVDKMPVNTSSGYLLDTYPSNRVRFITLSNQFSTATALATGAWSHVVARYDKTGGIKTIHVNGEEAQAATNGVVNLQTNAQPLRFGANSALSGDWFNGLLDEVRISSQSRSEAWLKAEYHAGAGTLLMAGEEEANLFWWTPEWRPRRAIVVDEEKIDADLTDFPVLVRLTTNNFDFAKARADGHDVRFALADGTPLDYERERHDAAAGKAEYWVRLPAVSSAADTVFYVYYGNPVAQDGANAAGVWAEHFAGVWHKNDATASLILDSTSKTNHGAKVAANEPAQAEGVVGFGQQYDGNNDRIVTGRNNNPTNTFTVSLWLKPEQSITLNAETTSGAPGTTGQRFVLYPEHGGTSNGGAGLSAGANGLSVYEHGDGYLPPLATYTGSVGTGWRHVAMVYSNKRSQIYLDGELVRTGLLSPRESVIAPWVIGTITYGNFVGGVDEVRKSSQILSPAWLKAECHAGKGTLATVWAEEAEAPEDATVISGTLDLNQDPIAADRSFADGIAYRVDPPAPGATTIASGFAGTLSNGIEAGDEILLINLQGAAGDAADVGNYELLQVSAVSATSLTVSSPVTKHYGGDISGDQKVVVQRVPHYGRLTVDPGSTLTVSAWDGLTNGPAGSAGYRTGILAFRAEGAVTVRSGGSISADQRGYRGGVAGGTGPEIPAGRAALTGGANGSAGAATTNNPGNSSRFGGAGGGSGGGAPGASRGTAGSAGGPGKGGGAAWGSWANNGPGGAGGEGGGGGGATDNWVNPNGGGGGKAAEPMQNTFIAGRLILGAGATQGAGGGGTGGSGGGIEGICQGGGGGKPDGAGGAAGTGPSGNGAVGGAASSGAAGGGAVMILCDELVVESPNAISAQGGAGGAGGAGASGVGGGGQGGSGGQGGQIVLQFNRSQMVPQAIRAAGGQGGSGGKGGGPTAGDGNGGTGALYVSGNDLGGGGAGGGPSSCCSGGGGGGAGGRSGWGGHVGLWRIAGRVTNIVTGAGVDGVRVQFSNGGGEARTAGGGYYTGLVGQAWSGTVTPVHLFGQFQPAQRLLGNVTNHLGGVDFGLVSPTTDLRLTAIEPAFGPVWGGTVTTITGAGFQGDLGVCFGTQAALTFTVLNPTTIVATAPMGGVGSVDVTVCEADGGFASLVEGFTYLDGVDDIPPAPPVVKDWLTAPQTNMLMEGLLTLSGTRSELCDVWVNGERVAGFGTEDWTFAATNLNRGVHAFDLYAMDRAGNTSEVVRLVFYVHMDKVFDVSTTLNASNNPYVGKCIMVSGATLTLDGTYAFDEVWVTNGGKIACAVAASATATNKVHLEANRIYVSTNSSIDASGVSRRDYNGNSGTGGSYGGRGGYYSTWGMSGPTYGSITEPMDMGTRSMYTPDVGLAGGVIYVKANELVLDGAIRSSGSNAPSYTGSGGSIWLDVGTLRGVGSVAANGGNGHSSYSMAGSGGGRVAIYYADASGFDLNRVYAYGGAAGYDNYGAGGAGTIYLKNKNEVLGRVIVNNSPRGTGTAPTELRAPIDAPLTVIGANVALLGNHVFESAVTMTSFSLTQSGTLSAPSLQMSSGSWTQGGTATVAQLSCNGMTWYQNAPVQVTESLGWSGGFTWWQRAAMDVPFGDTLLVSNMTFATTLPQTWDSIVVTHGGKLQTDVPGAWQTNAVCLTARTIWVGTNASIDVSGQGWTGTNASGGVGGSHGGVGGAFNSAQPPAAYGNYLEPTTPGMGGAPSTTVSRGGGVIRVTAEELVLNGALRANGHAINQSGLGAGAGGSIWVDVGSLSGSGWITANGGAQTYYGGGGGGGRVAVYYREASGFNLARVTALGGSGNNGGAGAAGSVHLENRQSPQAVAYVAPSGLVNQVVTSLTVRFQMPVAVATLGTEDVVVSGPSGMVAVANISEVDPITFRMEPVPPLAQDGMYTVRIGPDVLATNGLAMDQDGDGQVGESADDVFQGWVTVDRLAPAPPVPGGLQPWPATNRVRSTSLTLQGTREAGTEVWVNGVRRAVLGSSAWSHELTGLVQGTNTVTVFARDAAGNDSASIQYLLFVDTIAPVVSGVEPANGTFTNVSPAAVRIAFGESGTGLDAGRGSYGVTRLGTPVPGSWAVAASSLAFTPSSGLPDGTYVVAAQLADQIGNTGTAFAATFTLDSVAPVRPVVNAATTPTTINQQTLTGWREPDTSLWRDGTLAAALNAGTEWSATVPLSPGANTFHFTSRDRAGNESPATNVVIRFNDAAPGPVTVTAAVHGTGTRLTLHWNNYDELANGGDIGEYTVFQADQSFGDVSAATAIGTRPAGQKNFVVSNLLRNVTKHYAVVAADSGGMRNPSVASIAAAPVDVVAPANPTNLRFECGRTNLTVRWDAPVDVDGDLAGYRTYLGTNGAVAVNLATRTATWTGLEPATPYPVRVGSLDATGNEGTGTNGVGITWLSNPTNVTVVPADARLTLSWSASSPTQFVRRYLVYTGATAFASISNAGRAVYVTNLTTWVLTGLVNNATCHVAVATENVSGGIDPQVASLPGMPVPDAAGPELQAWTWRGEPLTNGQVLKGTGMLAASADDPAGVARLEFRISGAPQPLAATTNQTTISNFWNVADWADGPVVLLLRGWDVRSNLMEVSRSVAIELAPPTEMPTLTAPVHPTMTNATSVVLKGTVPPGYTHVMAYRNQSPLGFVAVDAQRRFETQVAVGEGANYLSAALVNRAGNGPQCSAVLVTSDQAVPATPKSVAAASRSDGEILVTWERGSLDSVAGYNLYAAPQAFASTGGVSKVNDTLLTSLSRVVLPAADGTWHYRVSALDVAGNESELSAEATAASDRVGPTATAIVYVARGAYDAVQKRFGRGLVDVDVYLSEPLMMAPYLGLTPAGGTVQSIALEEVSATRYHGVLTIDETAPSGLAYANFSARDVVGNRGTTVQTGSTVRIDAQAPEVVGLSIQPAAPIGNNATNPAQIQVTLQLSETAPQAPSLSYRLSATHPDPVPVALAPAGSNWVGALTLPATAGLPAESLSFAYQGEDDLGNSGGMIRAANSFEVYQGELPVLSTPYGLVAESGTGGVVRLTWEPVELAVGYRIYRRPAGSANYVEVGAVTNATVYQDLPAADGVYEYALASVRQVNQQQSISAPSQPPVSAVSDRVAPFAPSNLQLELRGTGVRLAWQAPDYTEPVQYRIYRAGGSVITNVAAATLLGGKVITLEIMDPYPSATQSVYAVTAADYVGNESPPAPSKYLNVNLLPVSTLAVEYQEGAYPLVSWTHSRSNNLGYALDVNGRTVTPPGYAGFWYVDSGYDRQEREYSIRAIDAQQEASVARTLRLPFFNLEPVASDFRRGMINVLRYRLSTTSTQAVSNVVIRAGVGGYTNVSATFDLPAGTTQEVKVVLGGRSNMLAVVPVRMQVEATPNVGELIRYVKLGAQNVGDGQFAADVYSDGLTRGGEGRIRFCLWNSGTEEVQVRVASQSGAQASPDVRYRLVDDDGNVFVTGSVKLALGSNVMTLASGDVVALVPPGGSFLSGPVVFAIPYNVPEKLNLSMEFDRVYYHCGMPDETFAKGPLLSRPVTLHNTTYEGMVTNVAPQTMTSATNVEITGWARLSGTQTPAADVPLRLVVSVNGFDRTYTVRTDGSGSFRHVFRPGDYENGLYYVWAVHPDRLDKPLQASFVMQSVRLDYASYDLRVPTAYDQRITLGVQAGGYGLNLTNLALVALAEDQPGGQLPAGLTFTPHLNAALASGGRINMTVGLRFGQTGSGTLVLRLASGNGQGQIWQRLPVNYTVSAAQPQVWLTPSYLEAGAVQNQTMAKTITLENRGLADLLGIQLNLVQPDGSAPPAWVNLASAASIASLAPGASLPLTVQFSPDAFVSEGIHSFQLRLTSSNAPAATYNVYAIVTRDAVGGLLFKVTDIYSGVPKANGDIEQGVYSARIQIQSESVATVKFEGYTDRQGELLLPKLPAGAYRAKVTAAAHDEYATRVVVEPAATALVKVPLNMPLVTVQWQVQPISLTDRYDVQLAAVYSTEVPAPVVLIEPMALTLPDMKQGDVYYGQYRVVNKGLIQAEELNWIPPTSDGYIKFELLGNVPNVLKSKEEFLIPFRVTALKSFNDESASGSGSGGRCGSAYSQLNFQFQCAVKDVYEAYAISSMHYGACAMSLAEYQAALNEMYYAEWIKRALANGATISEDGSGGGGNPLSGPGGESLSPLDFLSIQGACECTCDNDGDGVKDGCYPCNGKCYQCDSSGSGRLDSCFICDGNGDGVPDSCFQCDTDGDGKKDSCFNCDSDGDGKKDRCYLSDTDQDGIKDSCAGNCPITADNPNGDFTCDTDGDGKNDACFTCDSNGDGVKDVCFNCSSQTNGVNDSCLCAKKEGGEPVCGQCPVAAKKLNENVPDLDINKTLSEGSAKNVLGKIGKVPPAVAKVFPVSVEFSLGEFAGSGKMQWDCCEDYCTEPVKGYSIEASVGASASVKAKLAAPGFAGNPSFPVGAYVITVDWLLGGEVTAEASGQASVSREDKCGKVCEEIDATASLELRVFVGGKGTAKLVSNEVTVQPDGSQSVTETVGYEVSATVGAEAATSVKATCFGKYGSCAADPNCRTCWGGAKLEVPLRFTINLPLTEQIQFTWEFEKILYSAELKGGCE